MKKKLIEGILSLMILLSNGLCINAIDIGNAMNGWQYINGYWQYYNNSTEPLRSQWYKTGPYWHYSDGNGNMVTGLQNIGATYYLFDNNGAMLTGWRNIGEWYYFNADGSMATNRWVGNYYLGNDGKMLRNQWVANYYVDGNGKWVPNASSLQWKYIDGHWMYINTQTNEPLRSQWYKTGSYWHYSDEKGYMLTGSQNINGTGYLFDNNGAMLTGWRNIGEWYYFNADGSMATNRWVGNYYLGSDGKMLRNQWVDKYYVDGNGKWVANASLLQWQYIDGHWCYVNTQTNDRIKKQWYKTGSFWHYFDENGYSVTGWKQIDGSWYCFDNNGAMETNCWSGNYYLNGDGRMATNQWIGDYHVGADGAWDNITPTYYSQRDPRWASATYNGYTLQSTGCVPTSVAMAVDGILHNGITPTIAADYLVTTGEFAGRKHGGSGLAIKYGAEHWGLRTTGIDSYDKLLDCLNSGDIVVFQVGAGTFTSRGSTHAIVLFGNSNGSTHVYDPWNAHNGWYSISMIWNQKSTNSYDLTGGYVGYGIYK